VVLIQQRWRYGEERSTTKEAKHYAVTTWLGSGFIEMAIDDVVDGCRRRALTKHGNVRS
jgi:hypothetical protein